MMPDLAFLVPEAAAILVLLILLVRETLKDKNSKDCTGWFAFFSCFAVLGAIVFAAPKTGTAFNGSFIVDGFSTFLKGFFTVAAAAIIPMSRTFFEKRGIKFGEFILIFWASLVGLFFLASANDLLVMFITLEIFTLSLYVMAAALKKEMPSIEAGMKYMILGSLASAFVVYGIALIFVSAGTTSIPGIREYVLANPDGNLMLLGILFMVGGLGFKIASVPFQLWVPDVYEGAPAPVTAYLAVASKTAGFALLLRLLFTAFVNFDGQRAWLFSILAALTMLYGNLGALGQTNIKRLMGYSSIGHAGYLMIGLATGKIEGVQAILYYLMAYGFTNLCVFWVISLVGNALGSDKLESYRGLTKRSPLLAGALFIALFSLAGIPPMAGFFGKFLLLLAAVSSGMEWLAVAGVLGVVVSLYYYLKVIKVMYFEEPDDTSSIHIAASSKAIIAVLIAGILIAGFYQAPFWALAENAAKSLF